MSMSQFNAAGNEMQEGNASGVHQGLAEGHIHENAAPGDEAQAEGGNQDPPYDGGALGEISDEEIDEEIKEWLEAEETGGFLQDEGDKAVNPPEEPEANDKNGDIEEKLAEMEVQLAETREQLLRKAADFENFRKRMNQEKQKAIDFANESLLLDIIPIIDDFERAVQSAAASSELADLPAGKSMLDGISMIEKRLVGLLESKWGLKRFNSEGEPFDPHFHEAMFMEKSPDIQEPTVLEDFAKGYTLKDRVIRAAKVKVLMPGDMDEKQG